MIKNQRQYQVTKSQISKLESALAVSKESRDKMELRIYRAMVAGIESQIQDLQREVEEFEGLAKVKGLPLRSPDELPGVLIRARVARGLTQRDLARKLKLKTQQIQKYEATEYRSASLERVLDVMKALDLSLEAEVRLD